MSNVIPIHYCSFCGGSEHEMEIIITAWNGNSPAICNQCVDMCKTVIVDRRAASSKIEDAGSNG